MTSNNIKTAAMDLLYELNLGYIDRFNQNYNAKAWEATQVAKTQRQLAQVAIDLMNYAIMLDERNTLETESFLIEKIQFMIYDLNNVKNRIKLESRHEELTDEEL